MISHSPPIFSHSPPVSFLSDYMNNNRHQHQHHNRSTTTVDYNDDPKRLTTSSSHYCRPQIKKLATKAIVYNATNTNSRLTPQQESITTTATPFTATNNNDNIGDNNNNNINKIKMTTYNKNNYNHYNNYNNINNNYNNNNNTTYNNNNYNNYNYNIRRNFTTINRIAIGGGVGGVVGGSGSGSFFARVPSAPNIPLQPKSCLIRHTKTCQHHRNLKKSASINNNGDDEQNDDDNDNDIDNDNDEDYSVDNNKEECAHCRSRHKKVIFADDEGLSLTQVRVMSEPSNVPPYWSMKFLEQITQGLVSPHPADQWTVDFKQPASDYLSFRNKIDKNFVSLENVIVRDDDSIVMGTVKVKNISFEKEVIVRVTWDDWKSQQDIFCVFARAYGPTNFAHVIYDTFSFTITLPPSSKRLEFCICFRANQQEYWDNNEGKNYTITKRSPFYYNALSPYDKNSVRNSCQNHLMSSLSKALSVHQITSTGTGLPTTVANEIDTQLQHNSNESWSQETSPYW